MIIITASIVLASIITGLWFGAWAGFVAYLAGMVALFAWVFVPMVWDVWGEWE